LESQKEARQLLRELLISQRFVGLSTQSGAGPYASLIAFWSPGDLSYVVFATMRATRKFKNLVTYPRVALLFDNRSNRDVDLDKAVAVTATGTAWELTHEDSRGPASKQFLAKHPHLTSFVASPGCAFVSVVVDTYYVVTHFESVMELHMPGVGHVA
jgi:nitroimidazol reductase NimA-like FMN-containing flavoprotein (pyridoxamine 5'-phosphate oxidase superfamily)